MTVYQNEVERICPIQPVALQSVNSCEHEYNRRGKSYLTRNSFTSFHEAHRRRVDLRGHAAHA